MPHILLGYEAQGMATHFGVGAGLATAASAGINASRTSTKDNALSNQICAFMTIFITLQPAVQPLPPTKAM
jgi:hypothetical protein